MIKRLVLLIFLTASCWGCTKSETPAEETITVGIEDLTVRESDGVAAFIFNLSSESKTDASFDINVVADSATLGVDYKAPETTKVYFPAGIKTQAFNVYLINDRVRREDRKFSVTTKNPTGVALTKSTAVVRIINDNLLPEVYFLTKARAISKGSALAEVVLNISVPAPERFDIPYSVSGTGQFGIDHGFSSGIVTFRAGESSASIRGSIFNTPGAATNQTILFNLGDAPEGLTIGTQSSTSLIISDGVSNLSAIISGAPVGVSNRRDVNVSVLGLNVMQYKYKTSLTNDCGSLDNYSQSRPSNQLLSVSVSTLPDGLIFLCVIGGNSNDIFQDPLLASFVTWTKNTSPPSSPVFQKIISSFKQIPGGVISNQSNVKIEFSSLIAGNEAVLFDSLTCEGSREVGRSKIISTADQISATLTGDGNHQLSAMIFDEYSQGSACLSVLSKYILDTDIPTVTDVSISSPDGYYKSGAVFFVKVLFSKPIFVTGPTEQLPYVIMNTSPSQGVATFVSAENQSATFIYRVTESQNSIGLNYASQSALIPSGGLIKDLAGNTSNLSLPSANSRGTITGKSSIVVDTTPPFAVLSFTDGYWSSTSKTPSFAWIDSVDTGGSGILKYQISIGSQKGFSDILFWTDVLTNSFQKTMDLSANSTFYANVRAVDRAGNVSLITTGTGFLVDSEGPTTPVVTLSTSSTFDKTQSPRITWPVSTDEISGVDHYDVAMGSSAGATDVFPWTSVQKQSTYVVSYQGDFGKKYYVTVRAVDRAGNISTEASRFFNVVEPKVDPNPFPVFINKTNVTQGVTVFSNSQSIAGLDIPSSISVVGPRGNPMVLINGGTPTTSGVIRNGDSIQIQMTASELGNQTYSATINFPTTSQNWKISTWACPTNYVYVAAANGQLDFCVSKYQINISGTTGSEIGVSSPLKSPTAVDQEVAARTCSNLGSEYSLISNPQWQVLSKNIESVDWNWSTGVSESGILSGGVINSSVYPTVLPTPSADDNQACFGSSVPGCDLNSWSRYRRISKISTGEYLWDASGLLWQWTKDSAEYFSFDDPSAYYCPQGSSSNCFFNLGEITSSFLRDLFAPFKDYRNKFAFNSNPGTSWGGIGSIVDTHPDVSDSSTISLARGGSRNDEESNFWHGGIFSARITQGPHLVPTYTNSLVAGFRIYGETSSSSTLTNIGNASAPKNAAGGYGCNYPDCTDLAVSTCVDVSSCIQIYGKGNNCALSGDRQNPQWISTPSGSSTGHYVWFVSCDVQTGTKVAPGGALGAARCVYFNPPGN
jgi:hypothetical protein